MTLMIVYTFLPGPVAHMSTPHWLQSSETKTQVGIADEGGALSRLHPAFAGDHMYTFR